MRLPSQPVTLTPEQIEALNQKLSRMRHDINGVLSVIQASAELARLSPQRAADCLARLEEQPPRIVEAMRTFSAEFERTLQIRRE